MRSESHIDTVGVISSINPARGPYTGNTLVTILADSPLCADDDDVVVTVGGVLAKVQSQSHESIVVITGAATDDIVDQPVGVIVKSNAFGVSRKTNAFIYQTGMCLLSYACTKLINAVAQFTVTPSNGPEAGNNTVVIQTIDSNMWLGNNDINEVLVGNQQATIVSQEHTAVTVMIPPGVGVSDVIVRSSVFGDAFLFRAYTYNTGILLIVS